MRMLMIGVALLAATGLAAQEGGGRMGGAAPPTAPAPTCPASGYMPQAYYAPFGQNGGDGQTAYEIASPCIGKEVRDAAISIGMGRNRLTGVKNVITTMFSVEGTMADAGGMAKITKADFHMAYYLPAMRMFLNGTRANGQPLKEIRVFAQEYAWNETEEGRGATAALNTLNDRSPLLKLTPAGALWSVIDAEGHTKVTKVNGKTVLTGTSPYDGIEVAITLDEQKLGIAGFEKDEIMSLPIEVTAKANGHVWGATFADYRDTLEPNVWMTFPTQIKWTLDGKPFADFRVTYFRSNPYIMFPIPAALRGQAAQGPAQQLPPSAQRAAGNLPLRNVQTSYSPAGKRISPQDGFAMQQRSTLPTPRDADGHPDLSGNWGGAFPNPIGAPGLRRKGAFEPDQAAMQRGAQWNKPPYKPELWEKVRSLDFGKSDLDPAYGCHTPVGVPRQNMPARIVQKDKQIWLLHNVENGLRILPLDDRKRDELDHEYSFFSGQGLTRWEGDTLIIESVGFNDISWLGWEGYFHSDRMEVTERFLRQGDLLFYNFTVTDPAVFVEPWTSHTYVRRLNPNPVRQEEAAKCDERDFELLHDPFLRG